jgi:hypothetical protein
MKAIFDIISSIDHQPNVNPTEIYNEGWMTRILVYYSIQEKLKLAEVDFARINYWTSEALISSPFINASNFREGYTHADMALGDFNVDYQDSGKIIVDESATSFGIIEAKMASNLSQGTTHAENYNQGSRNLACIAFNTRNTDCDIFFSVVAPQAKIIHLNLEAQVQINFMIEQIVSRFEMYEPGEPLREYFDDTIAKAQSCSTWVMSYEDWIDSFSNADVKGILNDFYQKCLFWNNI